MEEDMDCNNPNPVVVKAEIESTTVVAAVGTDEKASGEVGGEGGASVDVGGGEGGVAATKRKRGRPRKNTDFTSSDEGLAPKRNRGRPPGSGKLQNLASVGGLPFETAGCNFKPHIMMVQTGEDVTEKIMAFSQRVRQCVCILSALGPVSSVKLLLPGRTTLSHKGQFEILKLSVSQVPNDGRRNTAYHFSVSLATPRGTVFGGTVAGSLIAAQPIQLALATFQPDVKKKLKMSRVAESSSDLTRTICTAEEAARTQAPKAKLKETEVKCKKQSEASLSEEGTSKDLGEASDPTSDHILTETEEMNEKQPEALSEGVGTCNSTDLGQASQPMSDYIQRETEENYAKQPEALSEGEGKLRETEEKCDEKQPEASSEGAGTSDLGEASQPMSDYIPKETEEKQPEALSGVRTCNWSDLGEVSESILDYILTETEEKYEKQPEALSEGVGTCNWKDLGEVSESMLDDMLRETDEKGKTHPEALSEGVAASNLTDLGEAAEPMSD